MKYNFLRFLKKYWPLFLLLTAAFLLYVRVCNYSFTNWDDPIFIENNPYIKEMKLDNLLVIFKPGAMPKEQLFIPLTYFSYLLESSVFGFSACVIHTSNLAFHLFNTMLCYFLIIYLSRKRSVAFFSSALFAFHPINVEAVAWCMGRKDLIMTFFSLLSLITYFKYLRYNNRESNIFYILSLILCLFALLSKPSAIVLPAVMLMIIYYKERKFSKHRIMELIPFCVLSILTYFINSSIKFNSIGQSYDKIFYRTLFVPKIIVDFFSRVFLIKTPQIMYLWYDYINPDNVSFLYLFTCLILVAFVGVSFYLRWRSVFFWNMFFVIFFAPPFGQIIYFYRDIITADRYYYIASIGFFGALISFCFIFRKTRFFLMLFSVFFTIFCIVSIIRTDRQLTAWEDKETLWKFAINHQSDNYIALFNLGNEYFRNGRYLEAEKLYIKANRVLPQADTYYNLGILYDLLNEKEKAIICFYNAVSLEPHSLRNMKKLCFCLYKEKRHQQALKNLEKLIKQYPEEADAYYYICKIFAAQGKRKSADKYYYIFKELKKLR